MPVYFHSESPLQFQLSTPNIYQSWLQTVANSESSQIEEVSYIFCTDTYLHQLNVQYLQHDTLTDVITFDYTETPETISGDVFISIDRVEENAQTYAVPFERELQRVMVHGLLHLLGYKDKTPDDQQEMRTKENTYLQTFTTFSNK